MRANFTHLYADIGWFGLLAGSTLSFIAIYAARLGANGLQVGLLSAGPALVNMLFSLPLGRWLESQPLVRANVLAALWSRLGYLLLLLFPALFGSRLQIWGIILLSLALSLPGTVLNIGFNAMFAGVVPPEWRAHVIGRRNAISSVSSMLTLLACGLILDRVVYPLNYQIVFAIGWIGAMISVYHLARIRNPGEAIWQGSYFPEKGRGKPGYRTRLARQSVQRFLRRLKAGESRAGRSALLRLDLLRGRFGRFMGAYLLFYTFQYVPIPLFTIYVVNDLGLTDGQISLGSAIFQLTVTAASLYLGRLSQRYSHHRQLVAAALLFGQYPLLLYFARDATLYWAASVIGGVIYGVAAGGLLNRLMECVPEGDRPAHMALHNLVFNMGILGGSLLGPLLGEWIGLRDAMLASAGLRFLAGLVMAVWG